MKGVVCLQKDLILQSIIEEFMLYKFLDESYKHFTNFCFVLKLLESFSNVIQTQPSILPLPPLASSPFSFLPQHSPPWTWYMNPSLREARGNPAMTDISARSCQPYQPLPTSTVADVSKEIPNLFSTVVDVSKTYVVWETFVYLSALYLYVGRMGKLSDSTSSFVSFPLSALIK